MYIKNRKIFIGDKAIIPDLHEFSTVKIIDADGIYESTLDKSVVGKINSQRKLYISKAEKYESSAAVISRESAKMLFQFVDKANEDKFNQIVADKANGDANNLVASEVFDISLTDQNGDIVKAGKITMTIPVEDANSIALVLHKPNGEWEVVDFTVSPDGKSITITLDSLSPIALLKVKQGGTNTDNKDNNGANNGTKPSNPSTTKPGVTSPQTGVNVNYFFAIAAVVAVCAAAVCVKRAKRA